MNVVVKEGDNLTIIARMVTTTPTSIIKATASSPMRGENATDRFATPETNNLCNNNEYDFAGLGRYNLYPLQATLGDDQTMLRIFISFTTGNTNDTITMGWINITG